MSEPVFEPELTNNPIPDESSEDFVVPNHKASADDSRIRRLVNSRNSRGRDTGNTRGKTKTKERKPAPPMPRNLGKQVADLYGVLGVALMPFDQHCATAIMESAETCGQAWEELAKVNPAVRRVLTSLVTTSAWSGVIMANAPIILAVGSHHIPAVQKYAARQFADQVENSVRESTEQSDSHKDSGSEGGQAA